MKLKKPLQKSFMENEPLPFDEDHKKATIIHGEIKIDDSASFTSIKKCKEVRCGVFGMIWLVASVTCSLILLILLKNDSSGKF